MIAPIQLSAISIELFAFGTDVPNNLVGVHGNDNISKTAVIRINNSVSKKKSRTVTSKALIDTLCMPDAET